MWTTDPLENSSGRRGCLLGGGRHKQCDGNGAWVETGGYYGMRRGADLQTGLLGVVKWMWAG